MSESAPGEALPKIVAADPNTFLPIALVNAPAKGKARMPNIRLPEYALTVTSRDLLARRARWRAESVHGRTRTAPQPYSADDDAPESGLVVLVDSTGQVRDAVPCDGVQGIHALDDGFLVARHGVIERRGADLRQAAVFSTHPCFNDLHSIRPDGDGFLLAASGTDCVIRVDAHGALRWTWWATEHGFDKDHFGHLREVDPTVDHRGTRYDTWLHTTHLNAAAAHGPDAVLVSLFHQGMVARVDRHTGEHTAVAAGLRRPHAVRVDANRVTFADSAAGHGYTGRMDAHGRFTAHCVTTVASRWLQDWQACCDGLFLAVDGEHSHVLVVDADGTVVRRDVFDPNWYLYEAALSS
jgi:hypothetical protein